jgi:hypothetical protein
VGHVSYLLRDAVDHEMPREAATLRDNDAAHEAIKQWGEMPDPDADRIIASLRGNGWTVTGKLRRDQPDIFAPGGAIAPLAERDCGCRERGDDAAWGACAIGFYGNFRRLLKKNRDR